MAVDEATPSEHSMNRRRAGLQSFRRLFKMTTKTLPRYVRSALIDAVLATTVDRVKELEKLARTNDADLAARVTGACAAGSITITKGSKLSAMLWAQTAADDAIAKAIAVIKSKRFNGQVRASVDYLDTNRIEYHGDALPAAPEMQATYPNGWCLSDSMTVRAARKLVSRHILSDPDVASTLVAAAVSTDEIN